MPTVNPSQASAGEEITAAKINTPVNQLAAVLNGNLDADNLADSAVATAKIADSGVTTQKIADDAVTSEKHDLSIGFHAYRNTSKTIGNSVADVVHDTERYDYGSDFNTTTGVFTCPKAGVYRFSTALECGASAQTRALLQFTGSTFGDRIVTDVTGTDINKACGFLEIDCALNETVKVRALLSNTAQIEDTETWFAGSFVG